MSAIELVVRSASEGSPAVAPPLRGLLNLLNEGFASRLRESQALTLLVDLGHCLLSLGRGQRDRATLSLYVGDEAWEVGLEVDGPDVLLSLYRTGHPPEVVIFERPLDMGQLRGLLLEALSETATQRTSQPLIAAVESARGLLEASPWPSYLRKRIERADATVAPRKSGSFGLVGHASFRRVAGGARLSTEGGRLERADLHSLLARGEFLAIERGRKVSLDRVSLFLLAEQLLVLAEEVLEGWRNERALFRRVRVDGVQVSVRRAPGEGPLSLTLIGRDTNPASLGVTLTEVDPKRFVQASTRFALSLCDTFREHDPSQAQNLRLGSLERSSRCLAEALAEATLNDSLTNPEPDRYRSFGLPQRTDDPGQCRWEHGAKMRFLPRWVATVPGLDLRATFHCGDRLVVGGERETACLDRVTGQVLWRIATQRAAAVVTPVGLARLHSDGTVALHDLETGDVRFTTYVTPRAAGDIAGAVVSASGLPKLLVVAEGDRAISAIDLVLGEVRWRYFSRRSSNFRMRRAGKLLLLAGGDSALLAIDVATGEVVWRVRDRLPFSGDMVVDHDAVFAVSGGPIGPAKLHHVDLWSGAVRWSQRLSDRPALGQAPLLTPEVAVALIRDCRGMGAAAYSRSTGELLWEQAPGTAGATSAWLSVDQALLANSAAGTLVCLDAKTGKTRYSHIFSHPVEANQPRRLEPVLRNGALFVPQYQVHVVRPRDGEILGTVPTDLIPDLLRVDEHCNVYICEESGLIAAFGVAPRLTLVT